MQQQIRTREIKIIPIGNSQGVRIPKALLQKYGFQNTLLLEETDKGLLFRNKKDNKLSWEETYTAMASEQEKWDDLDVTLFDGLEDDHFDY